jgi:2-C-methyl-D-erythritol 4-phosphate cytidylyltransferase/2-C-methyl-D-erythritol 2,4-cyclodiphosphate synthase
MRYSVVIVAAGKGTRLGGPPKQFRVLAQAPLFIHTINAFLRARDVESGLAPARVVCVVAEDQLDHARGLLDAHGLEDVVLCPGGQERVDSVQAGFARVDDDIELVAIHDAARPMIAPDLIARTLEAAQEHGCALPALPASDTIKLADDGFVAETIARQRVFLAQTPQVFRRETLAKAFSHWEKLGRPAVTDDAQLAELAGLSVKIVDGDPVNFKVTVSTDLESARRKLEAGQRQHAARQNAARQDAAAARQSASTQVPSVRVGIGYDVHRLVSQRPLILGGVKIDFELGLDGHSDADVLAHAISDAILGAAALGDIGQHFPPSDDQWKGADSIELLKALRSLVEAKGYRVSSIDSIVVCERPKLAPHIPAMRRRLAEALHIQLPCVSVKATTSERLGFTGRKEGIAAQASAVLEAIP